MADTMENLKEAFAGESQANQRYHGFAKKAEDDGLTMVARLFRAAAAAETVHAQNHLDVMGTVGETAANLEAAMAGEAEEFESMYPAFIATAEEDGNDDAAGTFDLAMQVEQIHYQLYSKALEAVEKGEDLRERKMFVCRGCGNTVEDEAPDKCPICGAPKSWFMHIE
ncbi:MAG: rubrerythrin [Planctomycetes bacterium SM23_32]|nr:MAG: rubrerythrin [Planctomycetes bacterium SM23_32]